MVMDVRVGLVAESHFPRVGGAELDNHAQARELARMPGTHVSVACDTMPEVPRDFPYPYPVYRARSFSMLTPVLKRRNVERMVRREGSRLLYGSMLHGAGFRAVEIGARLGLPVVVKAHGCDLNAVPQIGYGATLRADEGERVRRTLAQADRILVPSRMLVGRSVELGAAPERVRVLRSGVPAARIAALPAGDARVALGLDARDFVLLTVGRASPVKRIDLLYRAVFLLRREIPRLRCVSVGPVEPLRELARACGVRDRVVLTGIVLDPREQPSAELVRIYRAADLYVSTSWTESFGNAALEALACGTPVLVGRRHGAREILHEGETGFVLDEETPERLAETLVSIARRRAELRAHAGDIARSVAGLSWEENAARLRAVCEELL